jgi:hypothetical protein
MTLRRISTWKNFSYLEELTIAFWQTWFLMNVMESVINNLQRVFHTLQRLVVAIMHGLVVMLSCSFDDMAISVPCFWTDCVEIC